MSRRLKETPSAEVSEAEVFSGFVFDAGFVSLGMVAFRSVLLTDDASKHL